MPLNFRDKEEEEKLAEFKRGVEENKAKALAAGAGIPYLDLRMTPVDPDALALIPKAQAIEAGVAIIQRNGKHSTVVLLDPKNQKTKEVIKKLEGEEYVLKLFLVSKTGITRWGWDNYRKEVKKGEHKSGEVDISPKTILKLKEQVASLDALKKEFKNLEGKNTTQIVELLLAGSLALKVSDIHLQPEKENARLRFRIDGLLVDIAELPTEIYRTLKNRLKLVSDLSLNIVDTPQDGRFTIVIESETEVRVSTLPSGYGEGIVMRVLDPQAISVPLEELGFSDFNFMAAKQSIAKPNGMIILTGPTGSGKTTTLYAFIKKLNSPDVKIITVEDPIEYKLPGISQTQVEAEKGMSFASALRSILRQDPDIILVGEMRDAETVETALHAALTGHLVFSTLHTNNAVGAIPRLIDVGAKPAIIAPAVNLIVAQRLVRKVCVSCKKTEPATASELAIIHETLKNVRKDILAKYPVIDTKLAIARPVGCSKCNEGYKGRIGIHELFPLTSAIRNLILKNPSQYDIEALALKEGMITLKQDGYLKVLKGITTLEEVDATAE